MTTERKKTHEWLVLISLLLFLMSAIYFLAAKEAYSTTDSASIVVPSPTNKLMQCYGAGRTSGNTYNSSSRQVCGPGSKNYNNNSDCNDGDVAVGVNYDASLWNPSMFCRTRCRSIDFPQTNCDWRS